MRICSKRAFEVADFIRNRIMSVLFGHPTGNPNSLNVALAHFEAHQLEAFCVPWMPSRLSLQLLDRIIPLRPMARRLGRRHFDALADAPKELVLSACFLPMILAIISRRVFVLGLLAIRQTQSSFSNGLSTAVRGHSIEALLILRLRGPGRLCRWRVQARHSCDADPLIERGWLAKCYSEFGVASIAS